MDGVQVLIEDYVHGCRRKLRCILMTCLSYGGWRPVGVFRRIAASRFNDTLRIPEKPRQAHMNMNAMNMMSLFVGLAGAGLRATLGMARQGLKNQPASTKSFSRPVRTLLRRRAASQRPCPTWAPHKTASGNMYDHR